MSDTAFFSLPLFKKPDTDKCDSKDVIVALIGLFNQDDVLNHAVEFTGSEETLRSITIDERMTIANMTTEWGALSGLVSTS